MSPSQVTSQAFELLKTGSFQFLLPKTNIEFKCQFKYPNPFQARSKVPSPPPPQGKDDSQMPVGCSGRRGGHGKAIN